MISRSILFYWSKGAETRRQIIMMIYEAGKEKRPCYLNLIAQELGISHAGVKKHMDLLIEEKYVEAINQSGKPVYLKLSQFGKNVVLGFSEG